MYSKTDRFANSGCFVYFFLELPILKDINRKGGLTMILFLLLFFCLQSFVLFCCLAAGNDPASQAVSDEEQLEYIRSWMKQHRS